MMPMSDYELTQMRATQTSAFPDLATIRRRSITSDGFGGATTGTPTQIATDVPARFTQAQVQVMGGQVGRALLLEKWTIRMPYGTDLQDEDFVDWQGNSLTIKVEDVKERSWDTAVSAMGEVVK